MSDAKEFAQHIEGVARMLLGEPNRAMSSKTELRFGTSGSMSIDLQKGTWFDHEAQEGGGTIALVTRCTGHANGAAVDWLRENGFHVEDRRESPAAQQERPRAGERREIEATYDYVDEQGDLLYQVVRWVFVEDGKPVLTKGGKRKKTFSQRRPSCEPGCWVNGLDAGAYMRRGAGQNWARYDADKFKEWKYTERRDFPAGPEPTLYRLPDLLESIAEERTVFLVEGEKKVDALRELGIPATCNTGGSKKWSEDFAEFFKGANVVILPDNDGTGRQHAEMVAKHIAAVASRVRVLDLARHWTEIPEKGDIVDWLAAGGTAGQLFALVQQTPPWAPSFVSAFGAIRFEQLDEPGPEHEYVIDGWYSVADKSVVGGPSKSGKSFFGIHSAMSMARGTDFFGAKVRRRGLVIYQAGEGARGIKKRLRAYRKHFGVPPDEVVPFVLLQSKIDLYSKDGDTAALITEIKTICAMYPQYELVAFFIDTLATATGGADENSGRDMGAVMANVDRINKECGCHVCLVHHMNAGGTKLRGHTSIYANIDQVIFVTRDEATKVRTAVLDKQKDDEDGGRIRFELASVEIGHRRDDGKAITSCVCVEVGERTMMERRTVAAGALIKAKEEPIFRALLTALKTRGVIAPPEAVEVGVPADAIVVHYRDWREAFKLDAAPDAEGEAKSDDAIRKMFERDSGGLVKFGLMGWKRPWLWWTGKSVRGFPETQHRDDYASGQNPDRSWTSSPDGPDDEAPSFFD